MGQKIKKKVATCVAEVEDAALASFYACHSAWLARPSGHRFNLLAQALLSLIEDVIRHARQGNNRASLSGRIPGTSENICLELSFDADGCAMILNHRHVPEMDEVIQDYLVDLLDRIKGNPDFRIEHRSFIRQGLVLKARTLERSGRRRRTVGTDFENVGLEAGHPTLPRGPAGGSRDEIDRGANLLEAFDLLKQIWFHHPARHAVSPVPPGGLGLSLRHLYAAIRVGSSASAKDVAEELGLHPSRITALGHELPDLLSHLTARLLPLGDFPPVEIHVSARRELALGRYGDGLDLQRRPRGAALREVQWRKRILWEAYRVGYERLHRGVSFHGVHAEFARGCRLADAHRHIPFLLRSRDGAPCTLILSTKESEK